MLAVSIFRIRFGCFLRIKNWELKFPQVALTPLQQSVNAIQNARQVLIAPSAELDGDTLASSYAVGMALERAGKSVCVLLPQEEPKHFSFFPKPSRVSLEMAFDREYALSIDTRAIPVKDLRYEQQDGALKLYLTAPSHFSRDHVSLEAGPHKHDLVVVVGATDLEGLGETFEKYPQAFSEVPVLNIDRRAANERFGDINFIDITASTVSELVLAFLESWDASAVTEEVATCLLAGIIDGTKSFSMVSVTPRTLTAAARLLTCGAKQNDVVRHLYRSRSINQLRFFGKLLARMEFEQTRSLAYATLEPEDFAECEIHPRDVPRILEDVHFHFLHFVAIAVFFAHQNGDTKPHVRGLVSSREEEVLHRVANSYGGKRQGSVASFPMQVASLADAAPIFVQEFAGLA